MITYGVERTEGLFEKDGQAPYDYMGLLAALKRNRLKLTIWMACCLGLAALYLIVTPAEYIAYTQVILESPKRQRLAIDSDGQAVPMDPAQADSRIQVIKSERLLRFVFDTLKLDETAPSPNAGPKQWVMSLFSSKQGPSADSLKTQALLDFMDRVSARRIGLSYVIEISYRAPSAREAARMVNSITAAYIRDLVISGPADGEILQRRIVDVAHDAQTLIESVKAGQIPETLITQVDARVISAAIEPLGKSSPHGLLALLFAGCLGLTTGLGLILYIHNRDRMIRSERQARILFGLNLLSVIPPRADKIATRGAFEQLFAALPQDKANIGVGIVSWQSRASTDRVASGLARIMAESETVTQLSPHAPSKIETAASQSTGDLRELLVKSSDVMLDGVMPSQKDLSRYEIDFEREAKTWLKDSNSRDLAMRELRARGQFIMDLPPIAGSAAVKTFGPLVDGVVLVLDEDTSSLDEVISAYVILRRAKVEILGVVFTIADDADKKPRSPSKLMLSQWFARISSTNGAPAEKFWRPRKLQS